MVQVLEVNWDCTNRGVHGSCIKENRGPKYSAKVAGEAVIFDETASTSDMDESTASKALKAVRTMEQVTAGRSASIVLEAEE